MSTSKFQSGFAPLEVVLVAAVVVLVGFLGYTFYTNSQQTNGSQGSSETATANDTQSAPAVNSTSDLDTAANVLDQTDPGAS